MAQTPEVPQVFHSNPCADNNPQALQQLAGAAPSRGCAIAPIQSQQHPDLPSGVHFAWPVTRLLLLKTPPSLAYLPRHELDGNYRTVTSKLRPVGLPNQ